MLLGAKDYTRKRPASGSVGSDGRYSEGAVQTTTITASVQPMDGRGLENLPERMRQRDVKKMYTKADLRTADAGNTQTPDLVVIDGDDYQVVKVEPHDGGLINHDKVTIVRQQET